MSNVLGILVSCLYCKWSLEMMDEHQQNWKEMALTIKRLKKNQRKYLTLPMLLIRLKIISRVF